MNNTDPLIPQFQLVLHQAVVVAAEGRQLLVRTFLHHAAVVQDDDLVGVAHRAQAVGHDHHRAPLVEGSEVGHDRSLVVRVEGVRRLVEEDELRVLVDRPGDQQPLLLPLAQPVALHADPRVVAQRQAVHVRADVGHLHGPQKPLAVDPLLAGCHVAGDRVGEDESVLHHRPRSRPPDVRVEVAQPGVAHPHLAPVRLVEAQEELHDRRLAAPARPDDGRHPVVRDGQAHALEGVVAVRPVVAEEDVLQPQRAVGGQLRPFRPWRLLLVLPLVDLAQPLQADLGVLQGAGEGDELLDRRRELAHDVGERHHHAQRHAPLHHRPGGDERDEDVGRLVEKEAAQLLVLLQRQSLHADLEQLHLNPLPLPAHPRLAVVQLDLLHSRHQLDQVAPLARRLGEALDVELPPVAHEGQHPRHVKPVAHQEEGQHAQVVVGQDEPEDDEVDEREEGVERRAGHERLDPVVVAHPLQQVAHHLRVKETQRQSRQLRQEVGDQRDVDPAVHVQQDPAPDELHRELGGDDHQLGDQDEGDEAQVVVAHAHVDQALRQEGEDELQQAGRHHAQDQLPQLAAVGRQVAEEIAHAPPPRPLLLAQRQEVGPRLQQQGRPRVLPRHPGAQPAALELLPAVDRPPRRGVGDVETPLLGAVADHEMRLVPMQDAGQGAGPLQLVDRHPHAPRPEADRLRRLADAQHRDALAGDERFLAQALDRIIPPVIAGDHPQASRAAVHRVELVVYGEGVEHGR